MNAKLEVCFVTSWVNEMSDLDLVLLLRVAIFSAAYGLYLLRPFRAAYEMDDGPLDKTAVELVRHQAISMMPKCSCSRLKTVVLAFSAFSCSQ